MADPKLTKQQKDDAIELNKLLSGQPALLKTISGIWESINKSIAKSVDDTGDILKDEKAFVDISKKVLGNTKDIHKETVDWADISKKIEESLKSGDKHLAKQYKQMQRIQRVQKGYNNLVNAGANSIDKMVSGIEGTVRGIPFLGDFIADAFNFSDMNKNLQGSFREATSVWKEGLYQGTVEGTSSGFVESGMKSGGWIKGLFTKKIKDDTKDISTAAKETAGTLNLWPEKVEKTDKKAAKVAGSFSIIKFLAMGIGVAMISVLASMTKFAFETGLSVAQTYKLKGALFINKGYVKAMAEEFGTINDVNSNIAWQLKKQSFFYGTSAEQAVKLLRIQTALSDSSHEQLINVQNTVAKFARAKGVLPSKVFDDIAGATELMAKHASGTAEGFMKAAVHIRAMGVGLDVADQIATHLLDIEGSIAAQFEANAVLGTQMNFDMARRLMLESDLSGMMEEVKRQIGDQIDLEKLNVVQRELIAKAAGTDLVNLTKMLSAQEEVVIAATKTKNAYTAVSIAVMAIVGIIAGALMATKAFAKQGAKIFAGGVTGGLAGAAAGATIVAPFVNKVMATPSAQDGANVNVHDGEVILNPIQQSQFGGGADAMMAITDNTRATTKLEQTISKGQSHSSKQTETLIAELIKGNTKLTRAFNEG